MSQEYENNNLHPDTSFISDGQLDFECQQAFIRKQYACPDIEVEWLKFHHSIQDQNNQSVSTTKMSARPRRYFTFGALAGVAAVLLVLVISRWYMNYLEQRPVNVFVAEQRTQEIIMDNDEAGDQAILSLKETSDPLTGAKLSKEKADFRTVNGGNAIHNKTIRTPYGKDYRVVLNDGTEVIMNADSKLTFPTRFSGRERIVTLEGEAYFKVAKNPQMPFLVKTSKIDTRALGTEFNVKAYKGLDPHVTLIEGVVEVSVPDLKKNVRMAPNEDVSLKEKTLNIKDVDPQYYIQWKDGFFYYDDVALGDVMTDIGRWYNVNVEIEKPALMAYRLHFVVNRDAKIDDVIENLNNFRYLNVVKSGNKISIREKKQQN